MVTKAKKGMAEEKRNRVKVGKLKLNKETIRDLTSEESKQIKGGTDPGLIGLTIAATVAASAAICGGHKK